MDLLIMIYLFIIGIIFGSFYNVVAERRVNNESLIRPGSHCPNCKHRLSWYELIPVFSYIFLRGKCKKCKSHISIQYLLMELITGACFSLSYLLFGFSYNTLIMIIISSLAIVTFITDFKHMIILDEVLITSLVLGVIIYIIEGGWNNLYPHLIGGAVFLVIMLLIKVLGDKGFKKESLGWGDVKLSFIVGFFLISEFDIPLIIMLDMVYLFVGSVSALPFAITISLKKEDHMLAFGPYLIISMIVLFIFNSTFINILEKLLGVSL